MISGSCTEGRFSRSAASASAPGRRQPERADVVVELRLQHREAAVHPVGEDRLGLVEVARHAGVLRAAAGEHEDDLGRVADDGCA